MKYVVFAALNLLSTAAYAQSNTYPWPSSGNIGIGTAAPGSYKLNIQGDSQADVFIGGTSTGSLSFGNQAWLHKLGIDDGNRFYIGANGQSYFRSSWDGGLLELGPTQAFIFKEGCLGIGVQPQARLHVYNGHIFNQTYAGAAYYIGGNANGGVDGKYSAIGMASGGYILFSRVSDGLVPTEYARFTSNGYLGLGTTTPDYRITLTGDAETRLRVDASVHAGIYFTQTGADAGTIRGSTAGMEFFVPKFGQLMTLDANGNVGVGITNPSQKLSVNGAVRAKEVIVETTGWSDFVFEDGYPLKPLFEVEHHIKEHKHLPGMPSAREVAEQGVSVGDMQAKLLAKIEELTLHVIAQQRRIESLERQLQGQHSVLAVP
jgi:hypothetical protein